MPPPPGLRQRQELQRQGPRHPALALPASNLMSQRPVGLSTAALERQHPPRPFALTECLAHGTGADEAPSPGLTRLWAPDPRLEDSGK